MLQMSKIIPYKYPDTPYKMKYFINTLVVERFFTLLFNNPALIAQLVENRTVEIKEYGYHIIPTDLRLIADDFDLSKRIKKTSTIINRIQAMANPKEFILNKLTIERNTPNTIETMKKSELLSLIKESGLVEEYTDIEQLRDRLHKYQNNQLSWTEYQTNKLKSELDTRQLKVSPNQNREMAIETLQAYENGDGELTAKHFKSTLAYNTYIEDTLSRYNLSTEGSSQKRQLRLLQYNLNTIGANTEGSTSELEARLYRFHHKMKLKSGDLTIKAIQAQLHELTGILSGTREILEDRLQRFNRKKPFILDYTDEGLQTQLIENNLSTRGDREDWVERLEIVQLRKENNALTLKLERSTALNAECKRNAERQRNAERSKYRSYSRRKSNEKKSKTDWGLYAGLAVGAATGALLRRNNTYTNLKF